jgi:signal transduction histidine kinase
MVSNSVGGLASLLIVSDLLPKAQAFLQRSNLIWLHVVSDATIVIAYFMIPVILVVVMRQAPAMTRFKGAMALFAAFILLCGISYAFDIITIWMPIYYVHGWEKAVTGVVSLATAVALIPQIPALARMRSPDELEAANERLAAEVRAREAAETELRHSLADLRSAVQELEQFAYITSHDLQAPLRSIAGFAQLLSRRYRAKLDGDALEFLDYIEQGTHQMQSLIQDLLALSRIGRAEPHFEERPLGDAVERALRGLREMVERTGAKVEYEGLPAITAQHDLLVQLLHNLIGNAIKFQKPGVTPLVHIDARREGEFWQITVADNGIGIPQDQLDNVFVVFRRLHATHEYEGTGIGLAICRKIAGHHGGSIWATSDASGSQFHVRLPVQPIVQPRVNVARVVTDVS